jgi:hypothetical protein
LTAWLKHQAALIQKASARLEMSKPAPKPWSVISKGVSRLNYWEIIPDNLSKAGWSWGCVATVDRDGANDLDY